MTTPEDLFPQTVPEETEPGVTLSEVLTLRVDEDARRLYLTEDVTHEVLSDLGRALTYLTDSDPDEPIELWVCSDGGDGDATLGFLDLMDQAAPIITIGYGTVASAAAIILAYGKQRLVLPRTTVLVHGPVMWAAPREAMVHAQANLEEEAAEAAHVLDRMVWVKEQMAMVLQDRTNLKEQAAELMDSPSGQWFRGGPAIVQAGIADGLMEIPTREL